jgi:tetratricopeptide (TPR) repeat protein
VVEYRSLLGLSQTALGDFYRTREKPGDLDLAEKATRDAIDVFTRLVKEYPEVLDYHANLGGAQGTLAIVLDRKGDGPGGLDFYTQAIQTLRPVLEKGPRHRLARSSLRNAYANRAGALWKEGRRAEALADLDRALEFDDGDRGDLVRFRRLGHLAQMGEHARATAEAGALAARPAVGHDTLLLAAEVFALAVPAARKDTKLGEGERGPLSERYAARAVELLTQAQTKKFIYPGQLERNDDFAPLREREDFRKLLVGLHYRLFTAHYDARRAAEAEAELLALRQVLKDLAAQRPGPGYTIEIARTHFNVGQVYEHFRGDPARAEAEHRKALEALGPLAERHPADKDCAALMAECYAFIGVLRSKQGKGERDALGWFDRAVAALDPVLAKEEPGHARARQVQRDTLLKRAKALGRLGEPGRGVEDLDRALRLADTPAQRFALAAQRGVLLGRQGKHAEAAAAVAAADSSAASRGALYDLACVYALCSAAALRDAKLAEAERRRLSEEYASRAVAVLREAAAKGFRDAEHVKTDSDLDALRGRDDYRKLLAELTPPG